MTKVKVKRVFQDPEKHNKFHGIGEMTEISAGLAQEYAERGIVEILPEPAEEPKPKPKKAPAKPKK